MTVTWQRLGRLTLDTSRAPWAVSHAALPVVEPLDLDTDGAAWRVYLSLRDADGRARIGQAVLHLDGEPRLDPVQPDPVLDLGRLGAFDDNGVTTSCLVGDRVRRNGRRFLYYTGWSRGVTVPFYLHAGIAVSDDGGPFERLSSAPLLDRTSVDPFLTASPFVLADDDRWRMWYVSGSDWRATDGVPRHYYNIRYAESSDGLSWDRDGTVCLDYANEHEHAFARPWVVRESGGYRMWFAVRGDRYAIEMADSLDGRSWARRPTGGLTALGSDWESEMVEYPCVFDAGSTRYMLYNGNDYGRTGLGVAVAVAHPDPLL